MYKTSGKPKPPMNPAVKGKLKYMKNLNRDPGSTMVSHYMEKIP